MAAQPMIRPPGLGDRDGWDDLWRDYLRLYPSRLEPELTELTWSRPRPTLHPIAGTLDVEWRGGVDVAEGGSELLAAVDAELRRPLDTTLG